MLVGLRESLEKKKKKMLSFDRSESTDWNSAIQELLEKQGVDIKHEMERK